MWEFQGSLKGCTVENRSEKKTNRGLGFRKGSLRADSSQNYMAVFCKLEVRFVGVLVIRAL